MEFSMARNEALPESFNSWREHHKRDVLDYSMAGDSLQPTSVQRAAYLAEDAIGLLTCRILMRIALVVLFGVLLSGACATPVSKKQKPTKPECMSRLMVDRIQCRHSVGAVARGCSTSIDALGGTCLSAPGDGARDPRASRSCGLCRQARKGGCRARITFSA